MLCVKILASVIIGFFFLKVRVFLLEKRNTQFHTIMMQILKSGKQIHVENSEDLGADPVFSNDNILVENRFEICFS